MAKQFNSSIEILSACHGSIYRGLMALYYFKDPVRKEGLEGMFYLGPAVTSTEGVDSGVRHGTCEELQQAGANCQGHHVKQVTRQDYEAYDYLIGMDGWNIRNMNCITGGDPDHKIYKPMGFTGNDRDMADPWYTGDSETT